MADRTHTNATFIGCPVGVETKAALNSWRNRYQGHAAANGFDRALRWTRPESLHITLHYFGRTKPETVDAHRAVFGKLAETFRKIPLRLRTPAPFPPGRSNRRASMVAMSVEDPAGQLRRLNGDLRELAASLGLHADERNFRPHVTVGRMRSRDRRLQQAAMGAVRRLAEQPLWEEVHDEVSAVHWYRSVQQPGGNLYEPLATWPLQDS